MTELHEIPALLIGGIIDVIQDYFEGNLAQLTPSIAGQTLHTCDMFTKHTLDWQTTVSGKQQT